MRPIPYTITNDSVVVIVEGKTYTVKKGDENYDAARKAVIGEDWQGLLPLFSKGKAIEAWAKGHFTFKDNFIWFKGERVPSELNTKMIGMAQKGTDPSFLMKFWERLQKNPSMRSVEQLWPFLDHKGIPITKDGCFLAYKGVNSDYTDCHSGKFDNRPGATCEMPRNKISDDPRHACHYGFHVGAMAHASGYGSRMIVCKVDPADVVCIPYDAGQQKMRVCKYVVVGLVGDQLPDDVLDEDAAIEAVEAVEKAKAPKLNPASGDKGDTHPYMGRTLDDLRQYAKTLGIKNVKAIRGGKPALVERILQVEQVDDLVDELVEEHEEQEAATVQRHKPKALGDPTRDEFDFDHLIDNKLNDLSLGDLRKYAARVLKIVGASKIPGGKRELLRRIKAVRKED